MSTTLRALLRMACLATIALTATALSLSQPAAAQRPTAPSPPSAPAAANAPNEADAPNEPALPAPPAFAATGPAAKSADGAPTLSQYGDGQIDATDAIQRQIDAGDGNVVIPAGRYRITRPIVIDLDATGYVSLRGNGVATLVVDMAGPALRIVGTHFASADPGGFAPAVWQRQRMPLIDSLAFEGQHPESVAIEAVGTMQLTVTRCHIRGCLHGIHLVQNNRNVAISDCHIYENRGVGIFYDDVNLHQSNITGCHISYNDGGGVVSQKGNVRNLHITGCDIESNMGEAAPATANVLIDCRGSAYGTAEVAITGCTIQHNHTGKDSANVRIIGGSEPRADGSPTREGNITITGNIFSDVQTNVHLQDCRGATLTGNTFWMGFEHNLLIEDCSNVVVGANNLDRNPRYAYGVSLQAHNAVVFRNCDDCTIHGLHIAGVWRSDAGMVVRDCRRMNITGCTILDCDAVGLLLQNVRHSRISDCLIRDDRPDSDSVPLKQIDCPEEENLLTGNLLGGSPADEEAAR